jgi:hypothetical protein
MTARKDPATDDDAPIPGLAALRDVTPPPSLVPAVMQRIADPPPRSFWRWLLAPRPLELRMRVSPLGAVVTAGLSVAVLALVVGSWAVRGRGTPMVVQVPEPAAAHAPTVAQAEVLVRFTLVAQGARRVAVAGDFNGWDPQKAPLMDQDGKGSFAATVKLPPGAHQYMFVVDGEWVTDPAASEQRPDGFGRTNSVLRL